jgi:hypothetical protein
MLVLTENQIKNIISQIVRSYLQEISVKDVTKRMGWKSPKPDPFKKKKLTHVNMHAPGLMGENKKKLKPHTDKDGNYWVECPFIKGKYMLGSNPNKQNISEWRGDRSIPFEEPEFANKANYEHFIDFLENIGRYGQISGSGNVEKLYNYGLDHGFEYLKNNNPTFESDFDSFYNHFRPQEYPEYYIDGEESNGHHSDLTDEGLDVWDDFLWDLYQDRVDVRYKLNERNLIYIYRAISIPDLTSTNYSNEWFGNPVKYEDYYEQLNRQFYGVGMCWSYEESGAILHSGGRGTTVIIYGLISPDNIDWIETCALNGSGMDEREIRTKTNVPVEIYQIKTEDGKKFPLKKTIIVPSGEH